MPALILIHRWLGVAFCLLFAMWFASGMVMHFVPFPALSEDERVAGLSPFGSQDIAVSPQAVMRSLGERSVRRLRLAAADGTVVYVAQLDNDSLVALDAKTGQTLVVDEAFALDRARAHWRASLRPQVQAKEQASTATGSAAHSRAPSLDQPAARVVALQAYDQWTVPNGYDAHRPLYRVALADAARTELYVSSVSGEIVLDTTGAQRAWNWVGSVLHWIYPTVLRQQWLVWDRTVWWLSLAAMIGALTGTVLGILRLRPRLRLRLERSPISHCREADSKRLVAPRSPYLGWMKWHHLLGLGCALFVLTWIFSGWLSMDHGRLFSRGTPTGDERMRIAGRALTSNDLPDQLAPGTADVLVSPLRELEWFAFAGQIMLRVVDHNGARFVHADSQRSSWLTDAQMAVAARALSDACVAAPLPARDPYPARSISAGAPVYRAVCGDVWFHIDGADGRLIEKLDPSRRAYRWAFQALHTLDFPGLAERPVLRSGLIVLLCGAGLVFSLTAVVIGGRRLIRSPR